MYKINFTLLWLILFATLVGMTWLENRKVEQASKRDKNNADLGVYTLPDLIYDSSEHFLTIDSANLDNLLDRIGDSRLVLLGESTHGTAEFYEMRARLTRELIEMKGFNLIAVEADWPDASRIDKYIRSVDPETRYTKQPFSDFPEWMWRNHSIVSFTKWLRDHNQGISPAGNTVRFYGLDFYNLYSSMEVVLAYLWEVDPAMAAYTHGRYGCLISMAKIPSLYTNAIESGRHQGCEDEVNSVIQKLRDKYLLYKQHGGERYFDAKQNARLVVKGEAYYRERFEDSHVSRNIRHQNLFETLLAVLNHHGRSSKVVVWAHNSHIGDSRATDMKQSGEANIGQRVRETFGDDAYLIGFGTSHGAVTAASRWGGTAKLMQLLPANDDSYEGLFHKVKTENFLLPLRKPLRDITRKILLPERLQRAIGTSYDPADELNKHYLYASLPRQFDEYIWFDETQAVKPLRRD